jgi:uncharacterized protein YukE
MAGAAGALRDLGRRLRGSTSLVVDAGAWRGPASEAFLVDGAGFQAGLGRAADALDQAAGALAELAARLEHAQAAWDRARRLAAVVGVGLDPSGAPARPLRRERDPGGGGVRSPAIAADPAASVVAGQAGLAACGGEAAVTEGAGLIVCPTLTAVGGALGAQAGRAAVLHVYDELAGPPADPDSSSGNHASPAATQAGSGRPAAVRSRPGPGG